MFSIRKLSRQFVAVTTIAWTVVAHSAYPEKAVKIVVGFAPGGTTDLTARFIAQALTEQMGKPFVVENRTGASGTIAYDMVAKSAPDGYTLAMADPTTAMVPGLFKQLPFNVVRDFLPVSQIISSPMAIMIYPGLKANTLKEFIALAKASPGSLSYGSGGVGSNAHLGGEMFKSSAGVNLLHVPYRGAGDAVQALLGGQVHMLISALPTAIANAPSGKLRVLAVASPGKQRSSSLPDVPTTVEAGLTDFVILNFFGIMAPTGTPRPIVAQLHQEIVKALANPQLRERFIAQGGDPVGSSPDDFGKLFRDEVERWGTVIRKNDIQPE